MRSRLSREETRLNTPLHGKHFGSSTPVMYRNVISILKFKSESHKGSAMVMIMINTCCQGQDSTDKVENPVWIEQKNYIATAREALYDSTCNICLMTLFDTDQDEDVHCVAGC